MEKIWETLFSGKDMDKIGEKNMQQIQMWKRKGTDGKRSESDSKINGKPETVDKKWIGKGNGTKLDKIGNDGKLGDG